MVAKGEKRAREVKETEFLRGGVPISAQKIESFKKRKLDIPEPSAGEFDLFFSKSVAWF